MSIVIDCWGQLVIFPVWRRASLQYGNFQDTLRVAVDVVDEICTNQALHRCHDGIKLLVVYTNMWKQSARQPLLLFAIMLMLSAGLAVMATSI